MMTMQETILWRNLRGNKLSGLHFRRQQVIDGCIADFYCHSAGLAVEVDGHTHDPDRDRERDEVLAGRGIAVLHFKNEEITERLHDVLERIRVIALERLPG